MKSTLSTDIYWQIYTNDSDNGSPGKLYDTIDGYWLIRPPCKASDNTQAWCTSTQTALTISAWSIIGNTVTFTAANNNSNNGGNTSNELTAGQTVTLSGFTTGTFFNGKTVTVLPTGLSTTQFQAAFSHANGSATESATATLSGNALQVSPSRTWNAFSEVMPLSVYPVWTPQSTTPPAYQTNLPPYQYTYEAEDYFTSVNLSSGSTATEIDSFDKSLTGDYGTDLSGAQSGDSMTYTLYVPTTGNQTFSIRVKTGKTHGIFSIAKDGYSIACPNDSNGNSQCDTYSATNGYRLINVETKDFTTGAFTITLTVTGKNGSSTGYDLVIDNFSFVPQS